MSVLAQLNTDPTISHDFDFLFGSWKTGILQTPMVGKFRGDEGEFFGNEEVDGRKVLCRFRWTRTNPDSPKWEQAFSNDGGKTWETNWIVTFTRGKQR
ncbi:MAG: hypothetical protein DMG63_19470 [Acidobacteria bacterium]|nr:MAG: hypothetical protein DMG63_19470 [Acidobacteriota bacterium]